MSPTVPLPTCPPPSSLGRDDLIVFAALGETWARLGRRDESESYFASLLEKDQTNMVVRIARGITRIAVDPDGAEADFLEALEQDDRNAQAHYGMALLVRKADLRKALDHLDRALDSNAELIDAVQLRALVRARLGERGALDDVDRLIESPTPTASITPPAPSRFSPKRQPIPGCSRTRSNCSPEPSRTVSPPQKQPATPT